MKKFTLLASLLMFITMTYAVNVIPVGDAMQASKNFLSERVGAVKASQMELVLESTEYSADGTPVTYRFSVGDKGFIIVSATDLANPILAFSLESNFKKGTGADLWLLISLPTTPPKATPALNLWSPPVGPKSSSTTPCAPTIPRTHIMMTTIPPLVVWH